MSEYARVDIIDTQDEDLGYIPSELITFTSEAVAEYLSQVVQANGQICVLPRVRWYRSEANDKDDFDKFFERIKKIASNRQANSYIGEELITRKQVSSDGLSFAVGWDNTEWNADVYTFNLSQRYTADEGVESIEDRIIYCEFSAALVNVIS